MQSVMSSAMRDWLMEAAAPSLPSSSSPSVRARMKASDCCAMAAST